MRTSPHRGGLGPDQSWEDSGGRRPDAVVDIGGLSHRITHAVVARTHTASRDVTKGLQNRPVFIRRDNAVELDRRLK